MNTKLSFSALALLALLAAPANALTLTNSDDKTYEVSVVEGEGDGNAIILELQGGANVAEICENGCTIKIDNGVEMSFNGDEIVSIQDGEPGRRVYEDPHAPKASSR